MWVQQGGGVGVRPRLPGWVACRRWRRGSIFQQAVTRLLRCAGRARRPVLLPEGAGAAAAMGTAPQSVSSCFGYGYCGQDAVRVEGARHAQLPRHLTPLCAACAGWPAPQVKKLFAPKE